MVIFGKWDTRSLTISIKPNSLTISLQSPGQNEVYSFDLKGRLWTAMIGGVSYRRGLDGKIVAKWGTGAFLHERRWLAFAEARSLEEQGRTAVQSLLTAVDQGQVSLQTSLDSAAQAVMRRAAEFKAGQVQADMAQYLQVYKPVGILPPDQYMAVVLQATEGCSFNSCTFCNFYRGRPFRIKTPDELRDHIHSVTAFLGEGMSLRRTIFLGDANALVVPTPRLLALMDVINAELDVDHLGGIYAFLDGFSGEKKSEADFRELHKRGLKRVYVGLESGSAPLLEFLNKPGKPDDALRAVQAMKSAGVAVGIIVLLGAGGQRYAREHVDDTIQLINRMELDLDDIIYFSELIESEGLEYVQHAYQARLQPLSPEERITQGDMIERGLIFPEQNGTPHISRYDIREFVY